MRASYNQKQKYENTPNAIRGVTKKFSKLMRPNIQYNSLLDEVDVYITSYGKKDFRVTSNGLNVDELSYKDFGNAKQVFDKYIERKKKEGWKVMNERPAYTAKSK